MKKILMTIMIMSVLLVSMGVVMAVECPTGTDKVPLQTLTVPSNLNTATIGPTLLNGETYLLEASGTWINSQNLADAEFASTDAWADYFNGYNIDPWYLGEGAFDLKVDNNFVDWGAYSDVHEYSYLYTGTDNAVNFLIFDGYSDTNTQVPGWYGDNSGFLTVDISQCEDITALTTPVITGFLNPSLPCNVITNIHSTTVDWTDSTGGSGIIVGYDYAINYPLPSGNGQGNWNTFVTSSQYSGSLNEGVHTIKVRAKDSTGYYSEWSNECKITADWTAPDVEIIGPAESAIVYGIVEIRGSVTDANPHHYWFVIQNENGNTVAGPGTVNEDESFTNKLLLSWDTTSIADGTYKIKLEARDSANNKDVGSVDWHTIFVEHDEDNDCVLDYEDKCLGTIADNPSEGLGVNRHIWNGIEFRTLVPGAKGAKDEATSQFSIADTYGCSCEQILDSMSATTGFDFGGHYKYGCSKGLIEGWISGRYHVGPTFVETVEVPANSATPVSSLETLKSGKDYFLKAYGTAWACKQPGCNIEFDAEYSTSDGGLDWVDGVAAPYNSYGLDLLDLEVDGAFMDWGAYNSEHTYQIPYAGTGNSLFVIIYDLAGSYSNNAESLFVDIIEDKWVDLW